MRIALLGLCVLALCACGHTLDEQNPETLTDQSGITFTWDCSNNDDCELSPLPQCEGTNARPAVVWSAGRFFGIAPSCHGPSVWLSTDVRYTVCATDRDCPQLVQYSNGPRYECRAGLCQNVKHEVYPPAELPNRYDMYVLCYGDKPRTGSGNWPPEVTLAVQEACPSEDPSAPCERLPAGCRDPR